VLDVSFSINVKLYTTIFVTLLGALSGGFICSGLLSQSDDSISYFLYGVLFLSWLIMFGLGTLAGQHLI
jgi:hypothetical protein